MFKINKTILILAGIVFLPAFGTESSENLQKVLRFLKIFSRVPETAQLALVEKLNPTELLNFYEHLEPLEKDKNKNFNGKEFLDTLAYNARQRVAKIFKCDTNEGDNALQNGTCRPLLMSKQEDVTPEQRNAQPFKGVVMTPDYWIKLLPLVDILNRWFYDSELWKIYFLQVIKKIEDDLEKDPGSYINIHKRLFYIKYFFKKNRMKIFAAVGPNTNKYDFYTRVPSLRQNEYSISFGADYFETIIDEQRAEDREVSLLDILKNQIKILYIQMLPVCIQKALLPSEITEPRPEYSTNFSVYKDKDYGIYVDTLLDDPYITKNIADFKEKIKHLRYPPKQVICPRSLVDIGTKKTRVINDAPSIFWTA